jgi:hypothetical protein
VVVETDSKQQMKAIMTCMKTICSSEYQQLAEQYSLLLGHNDKYTNKYANVSVSMSQNQFIINQ